MNNMENHLIGASSIDTSQHAGPTLMARFQELPTTLNDVQVESGSRCGVGIDGGCSSK